MTTLLLGASLIAYLATFHHEEAFVMTACEDDLPCVEKYVVRQEDKYGSWLHNETSVVQQ